VITRIVSARIKSNRLIKGTKALPPALQERLPDRLDRLSPYKEMRGAIVAVVQSSPKDRNDEMDCSLLPRKLEENTELAYTDSSRNVSTTDEEFNTPPRLGIRYGCREQRHLAKDCPPPSKKGKGNGKGDKGTGKGGEPKGRRPPEKES
jgi:hypothetical protein